MSHLKPLLERFARDVEKAVDTQSRRRVVELEAREQTLIDRVEELESLLGFNGDLTDKIRRCIGTTRTQSRILGMLLTREEVSRDGIYIALYSGRPDAEQPDSKTLSTMISKARTILCEFGIEIKVVWGTGWFMPESSKARLRALLNDGDACDRFQNRYRRNSGSAARPHC